MAKRKNRKGRLMAGILIGVKEESGVAVISVGEEREEEVMTVKVRREEEKWRIVRVYMKGDIERKLKA